jgi:L-asparaginase II
MSIELVHVLRGEKVESIHRGDIVGTNAKGEIIFSYGNPNKRTFWRSSAKPFQVLPLLRSGGVDKFKLELDEIALMTASHGGEAAHVETVKAILKKIGKSVEDLDCGVSAPMHKKTYIDMLKNNMDFTSANNPCSGKHSSMLAYGIINDYDLENYIDKNHIIQKHMLQVISELTDLEEESIDIAIDGCGVPVFGLPIYNMALAYSRLITSNDEHMEKVVKAMTHYPFNVAGTDRLDTILMEETNGKILAKLGAESVYCMGIQDENLGIALKIEDGSYRPLNALVPSLLLKHEFINPKEYDKINKRLSLEIKNNRKEKVGIIESII